MKLIPFLFNFCSRYEGFTFDEFPANRRVGSSPYSSTFYLCLLSFLYMFLV